MVCFFCCRGGTRASWGGCCCSIRHTAMHPPAPGSAPVRKRLNQHHHPQAPRAVLIAAPPHIVQTRSRPQRQRQRHLVVVAAAGACRSPRRQLLMHARSTTAEQRCKLAGTTDRAGGGGICLWRARPALLTLRGVHGGHFGTAKWESMGQPAQAQGSRHMPRCYIRVLVSDRRALLCQMLQDDVVHDGTYVDTHSVAREA